MSVRRAAIRLVAMLAAGLASCGQGSPRGADTAARSTTARADAEAVEKVQVEGVFYDPLLERPVTIEVEPVSITSSEPLTLPRMEPKGPPRIARAFADDGLTSRIGTPLPAGIWREERSIALEPGTSPALLLFAGERLVLQGASRWSLHGLNLVELARGALPAGGVSLDPEREVFYLEDTTGRLIVRRLSDGGRVAAVALSFGHESERVFVERRGKYMLVVSSPRALDAHAGELSGPSTVEAVEFESSIPATDDGHDTGVIRAVLACDVPRLPAALGGEALVVAIDGAVVELDLELRIRSIHSGTFAPIAVSLDEARRTYMLADVGGKRVLWVVTKEGKRVVAYDLPPPLARAWWPPVVGYDHRVFVLAGPHVLAVAPDGGSAWVRTTSAPVVGAIVTSDGQLILSAGNEVLAIDGQGSIRSLHSFTGETVRTPPVLTAAGRLVVATDRRLVALTHQSEDSPPRSPK